MTYVTIEGDMLDAIAQRLMGDAQLVVTLARANRHVAGLPGVLPAGLVLTIPETGTAELSTETPIRLWGAA